MYYVSTYSIWFTFLFIYSFIFCSHDLYNLATLFWYALYLKNKTLLSLLLQLLILAALPYKLFQWAVWCHFLTRVLLSSWLPLPIWWNLLKISSFPSVFSPLAMWPARLTLSFFKIATVFFRIDFLAIDFQLFTLTM